jgi:hypothetical protein
MEKLNLPSYSFRITKNQEDRLLIFDPLRKKDIPLTPEEWVRQNILQFLIEERGFPKSLISVEAGLKVNLFLRRYDALIYSREGQPLMLIECKATSVAVNQGTFDQITIYNRSFKCPYLLVTNGLKHYCCKLDENEKKYIFLENIPAYVLLTF